MPTRKNRKKNHFSKSGTLFFNLENLRIKGGYTPSEWAKKLELSERRYFRFQEGENLASLAPILELCNEYQITIDNLCHGQIDLKAAIAAASGSATYIPEKYLIAPYSTFQTGKVMFDYLEKKFGPRFLTLVGKHFQISPTLFQSGKGSINNLFFSDLFSYLRSILKVGHRFFFEMGQHSMSVNFNSPLGETYRKEKSLRSVMEDSFGSLLPYYEKNSDYWIMQLNSKRCLVRTKTKKDVADALNLRNLGNPEICDWKAGVFSSLPGYLGLKSAPTREKKCVHRGDPYCLFEISYEDLRAAKSL